jgi:Domain of unknown function (DUF3854)
VNPTALNTDVQDAIALRHEVYSALLEASPLWDFHREKLRDRGLSDAEIDRRQYRTDDQMALRRIARHFDRASLLSVPGIVACGADLKLNVLDGGVLVPCRNFDGRVVALKLRRDFGKPKYVYLTSKPDGPGPGSPAHVPLGVRGPIDRLRVTEGELKADAATVLNCTPSISIPGVGQWRNALPVIEELKPKRIAIAFDSDGRVNRDVARPQLNFCEHLHNAGFALELETWEGPKGIDDLLLAGGRPTVHVGNAALWMAREIAKAAGVDPSIKPRVPSVPREKRTTQPQTVSEFSRAKAAVSLAAILNEALGPAVANRWMCQCGKRKLTVRRDQLGIERMHCWGCDRDEDGPGFLRWHYGISFRQACERLGLPMKATPEAEPEPVPIEPVITLRRCPHRSKGVLLRKRGQSDVDSVHPPCGNRITCEPCRKMWQAAYRARFRAGLKLIPEGAVYKAIIEPSYWGTIQRRLSRIAKREKVELLYATIEHDTEAGDRRVLVITNLPYEVDEPSRPVKHGTASDAWGEALRGAVLDLRNPVTFSRTWPKLKAEPSDFERIGEITADPTDVRLVAPMWGFEVLGQIWSKDRTVCEVQGFDQDPEIALVEAWGFRDSVEEHRQNGEKAAREAWFFTRCMAIPFVKRCKEHQESMQKSVPAMRETNASEQMSNPRITHVQLVMTGLLSEKWLNQ